MLSELIRYLAFLLIFFGIFLFKTTDESLTK